MRSVTIFVFVLGTLALDSACNPNPKHQKNKNGCTEIFSSYLAFNKKLGYWTPGMQYLQPFIDNDSFDCKDLYKAVNYLKVKIKSQDSLLRILDEPNLDTLYTNTGISVYRAIIFDGHRPLVRMVRISRTKHLIYKVAEYIEATQSNMLLNDSTVSLFIDNESWIELNRKIRDAYFWDLMSNEFDLVYNTADSWAIEGAITKNNIRYYHRVIRLNPSIKSSYRKLIRYFFQLAKDK